MSRSLPRAETIQVLQQTLEALQGEQQAWNQLNADLQTEIAAIEDPETQQHMQDFLQKIYTTSGGNESLCFIVYQYILKCLRQVREHQDYQMTIQELATWVSQRRGKHE